MARTESVTLTNMCMVTDGTRVLVQDRTDPAWHGITFPGGHVEPGESFLESAIREVKEETGLTVSDLRLCGIVNWEDTEIGERYVVLLYRTSHFCGELLPETEEGKVFWVPKEQLAKMELCPNFDMYLQVFLQENASEFFGQHHGNGPRTRRIL